MFAMRRFIRWVKKCFVFQKVNRSKQYTIRPLGGHFYIEYLSNEGGDVGVQRVSAKHLICKDGDYYLYGWCERLPCYRAVPIERITSLADEASGECIPKSDIVPWLVNRSCH
jgi:hypothetical protein